MVHVPVAMKVATFPATVQTLPVDDVKLTAKPEVAVATSVRVALTLWAIVFASVRQAFGGIFVSRVSDPDIAPVSGLAAVRN